MGWIGVDLDGTLALYYGFKSPFEIGAPIKNMVDKVQSLLHQGVEVRIFTARIDPVGLEKYRMNGGEENATPENVAFCIEEWCRQHIGRALRVTDRKDLEMIELWDDRVRRVQLNTGEFLC